MRPADLYRLGGEPVSMTGRDITDPSQQFANRIASYDQRLELLERGTARPNTAKLKARLFRATNVNTTGINVWNGMPWDGVSYDPLNMTPGTAGAWWVAFTIPVDGYWDVRAAVMGQTTVANSRLVASIFKNSTSAALGTEISRGFDIAIPLAGQGIGGTVADIQPLRAGDTLSLGVYPTATTSISGNAGAQLTSMTVAYHSPLEGGT
jgi:hypothetical protein